MAVLKSDTVARRRRERDDGHLCLDAFSARLKVLRESVYMENRLDFGRRLGVSARTVRKMEEAHLGVSLRAWCKAFDAMGVTRAMCKVADGGALEGLIGLDKGGATSNQGKLHILAATLGGRLQAYRALTFSEIIAATPESRLSLAKRIGVSKTTLEAMESGREGVSIGSWCKAIEEMGLTAKMVAASKPDLVGYMQELAERPCLESRGV